MYKKISILGSTGSIGTQTLNVIRNTNNNIKVEALSSNVNIELLEKQIREFSPSIAAVMDCEKSYQLEQRVKDTDTEVVSGINGIIKSATVDAVDTVFNSLVGNIGLIPTLRAIEKGKNIALSNKETLVSAGELVMKKVKEYNVKLYPVDSEHSAIFQCLQGNENNKIEKIHLTASGGPFRGYKNIENITLEDALNHPNWNMGKKVTIDSATLMNKGLEVIEAKWLFDVDINNINILIHPQSIIHSMVEFEDGAVMAQLGEPDMKIPIQYALTYPARIKNNFPKINFFKTNNLTFEKPDYNLFPCLKYAFEAIETGGTMPAVMNGANEAAVNKFLNKEIKFIDIPKLIEKTMKAYTVKYNYTLTDIIEADNWSKLFVNENI